MNSYIKRSGRDKNNYFQPEELQETLTCNYPLTYFPIFFYTVYIYSCTFSSPVMSTSSCLGRYRWSYLQAPSQYRYVRWQYKRIVSGSSIGSKACNLHWPGSIHWGGYFWGKVLLPSSESIFFFFLIRVCMQGFCHSSHYFFRNAYYVILF